MSATPTVYFIDDSATMREVIKIAFRRENINVVACHDAASAFAEIENTRPDVVITDVIMPDKDGYEVCQYIKQNPKFSSTPVILMSGVVNRSVAEKAFSVKADELIRKPFQPQDLIARVRHLLRPAAPAPAQAPSPAAATAALSSIFAASQTPAPAGNGGVARKPAAPQMPPAAAPAQSPLVAAFAQPQAPAPVARAAAAPAPAPAVSQPGPPPSPAAAPSRASAAGSMDAQKLKFEIMRLEALVKKLQSELESERQYSRALEEHVKTLQESE
jgi:CheY-like chemotaxis protein